MKWQTVNIEVHHTVAVTSTLRMPAFGVLLFQQVSWADFSFPISIGAETKAKD